MINNLETTLQPIIGLQYDSVIQTPCEQSHALIVLLDRIEESNLFQDASKGENVFYITDRPISKYK